MTAPVTAQAARLRAFHRDAVRANRLKPDPLWGKPCSGYNVQIELPSDVKARFSEVQRRLCSSEEDNVFLCSPETLHITVVPLLSVRTRYARPKEELWAEISGPFTAGLDEIGRSTDAFNIEFDELVATDTAVIAIGKDSGAIARLRKRIADILQIPRGPGYAFDIIHVTLLRYRKRLQDPEAFLETVKTTRYRCGVEVGRIVVVKELVYPSVRSKILFGVSLGGK